MKNPLRITSIVGALAWAGSACAAPVAMLFVGNSYTFGRLDPVMSYNVQNVHDLTRPQGPPGSEAPFSETSGTNVFEPHPWGGVPGIFKSLADQAGLDYDVSMSARNAATLRGHFLNTANPDNWDLRGNIASRKWDVVVLQEQSDAPLPADRGANANLPQFDAYADKIEQYVHVGAAQSYRERAMYTALYGSVDGCVAAGGTLSSCNNNTLRTIPANPNANPLAKVYLTQTWARPDMVFAHLATVPDPNYPEVPDGRPIVDTTDPAFPDGFPDTLYYQDEGLAGMTADLHASFHAKAQSNPNFAGVAPVGDAFQRALDEGVAKTNGFYRPDGTYSIALPRDKMNLWWIDYLHASKEGSYLDALVLFGTVTGVDPSSFGENDRAHVDLGIAPADAIKLQHVATEQLVVAGVPIVTIQCLRANPRPNACKGGR
ncbi:MAG TPA: hypothetical protein VN858_04340 [Casimicrobiaceae bacterium]|nr:hypothetical protein [Casimicrobiaceae bacterium]